MAMVTGDIAPPRRGGQRRTVLKLSAALVSTLLTIVVCEFVLQLVDWPRAPISGWKGDEIPAVMSNQLGYRGHPIEYGPDDYVIVLLGDSQVHAIACAYDWMPERRLEHHLKSLGKQVRVVTIGAPGWGQDQQLLGLKDYFAKYRADLVLVWQSPVNDVWNNIFPTHIPRNGRRKPTYWLEGDKLCGPTESQIGMPIEMPRSRLLSFLTFLSPELRDPDGTWENKLPPAYVPLDKHRGKVSSRWEKRLVKNPEARGTENLSNEKSHFAFDLTPRSERMEYGLKLTNRLLHEIRETAETNSAEMVVFTSTARKHQRAETVERLDGKLYKTTKAQHEENIVTMQQGLPSTRIVVTVQHSRVSPTDAHLNEHAVDQVMGDLATQISDRVVQPTRIGERNDRKRR